MRPVRVEVTGVGVSAPIPLDQYQSPTNVGLAVDILTGTATYTVQHTFEDVFAVGFNPATAKWFDHPTLVGLVADADGNYSAPPIACRLNVAVSSGGTVGFTVVQAGAAG